MGAESQFLFLTWHKTSSESFFFFLFNVVGDTIAVCYIEKNCLSTLKTVALSHKGPLGAVRGDTPSSTSSDRGIKTLPSTEVQ